MFEQLEREGFEVTYLDVDTEGIVNLQQLREALREDTVLVSIMFVNNENWYCSAMYDIDAIVAESNALLHVDTVQAVGHLPIDIQDFNIAALSITAHKFGGPKVQVSFM